MRTPTNLTSLIPGIEVTEKYGMLGNILRHSVGIYGHEMYICDVYVQYCNPSCHHSQSTHSMTDDSSVGIAGRSLR